MAEDMINAIRFQSTLPRGERLYMEEAYYNRCKISIHAPTRGATNPMLEIPAIKLNFNPRSHEGSDERAQLWLIHL